ncbi:MAG: CpXC domain-containing protein [Anaerolineales bacterium]
MPYLARVNCPACGAAFQTPVEQVLDVRIDPEARQRMLSGAVNISRCPSCGTAGALNLPFLYHDPEKEVALLYLPMETGKTEMERQQLAGTLTRQVMNSLPPEERKGYLLQPETFINMDTMVRRVLELEGVSEEDMERNQAQQELLSRLLQTEREEWDEVLEEQAELVDEGLFALVNYVLRVTAMRGEESPDFQQARELQAYLLENTELGQKLKARSDIIRPFVESPSRETLLEALVAAPDEQVVDALAQMGLSMIDYAFFQKLNNRIEEAEDEARRSELKALRRRILDIRDEVQAAGEELVQERAQLLSKLLDSEEPLKMARSHLSELDDTFAYVLQGQLQMAEQAGNEELQESLLKVAQLFDRVLEENLPPQVALARRLLVAPNEEQVEEMLRENRQLLSEPFFEFLEALEQESRERGDAEVADRLAELRAKARNFASPLAQSGQRPQGGPQKPSQPQPPSQEPGPGEEIGPGGLIIAKK